MAKKVMHNDVLEEKEGFKAFEENAKIDIDVEQGIIRNLAIMTGDSPTRKRHYTDGAMRGAVELFEGAQAYIDHPIPSVHRERQGVRSTKDLIGWYQNIRFENGSPTGRLKGDLHLIGESQEAKKILWLSQNKPNLIGNSPRTRGRYYIQNGKEFIEQLVDVHSVDLVTAPSTTKGLFESANQEIKMENVEDLKKENKELYESVLQEGKDARNDEVKALEEKSDKLEASEKDLKEAKDKLKTLEESATEAKSKAEKTDAKVTELEEKIKKAGQPRSDEKTFVEAKDIKSEDIIGSVRKDY